LFVSTIESRKGHMTALAAWRILLDRYRDRTPCLVCVGNDGWLNEDFYAALKSDPDLRSRFVLLSCISDAELSLLYRECLFTIYPSLYEGWGLPITESFSYGKPVIAADNSSLPEAGGTLAVYVRSGSAESLADAVAALAYEPDTRQRLANRIATEFRPRSWSDIAAQIVHAAMVQTSVFTGALQSAIRPGRWYDFRRNRNKSVWFGAGSAERLRIGRGWTAPDDRGCWTRPQGGSLLIDLTACSPPARLILKIICRRASGWFVTIDGVALDSGHLAADEFAWAICALPPTSKTIVRIDIQAEKAGVASDTSIGIAGASVLDQDWANSQKFLEAVTLGRLDIVDAFADGRPNNLPSPAPND
jgi:hypothetical protein